MDNCSINKTVEKTDKQNIGDLLHFGKAVLEQNSNQNAESESILLLSYLLNKEKSALFLNRHLPVSPYKTKRFYEWVEQRKKGIPIQYITGFQNFMGLEFETSEGVFIPRSETEILVEKIIELIEMFPEKKRLSLLDLGAGSGVIPITVCSFFQKKGRDVNFYAVDVSEKALRLAAKNAQKFHCQNHINFMKGELFTPLKELNRSILFDGIISNPPYISHRDWKNLPDEVRIFEPPEALLGGEKGLDFYQKIIRESPKFLKPGGFLALEFGHRQKNDIKQLITENANYLQKVITFRDYYHNDRGIIAFKNSSENN